MLPENELFGLSDRAAFEAAALETFRFQAKRCAPYRDSVSLLAVDPEKKDPTAHIPFLQIECFKTCDVYCGEGDPEQVFTSSSTGGQGASRHPVWRLALYEQAFFAAFRHFYGDPARWSLYGLLPSYLEREGSSLVYMTDRLIRACGSGGFYLRNQEEMLAAMAADPKPKILLGVSYALWDLAERYAPRFERTVVMETGGMKGHREELPRETFHRLLCDAFGVETIHSEYGMAELLSQAYSCGGGIFEAPPWMRVVIRDLNDPFAQLPDGTRGGVNIIDLANRYSCSFIQTQDTGRRLADGRFAIEGRIERSDIRGCNLLVQ